MSFIPQLGHSFPAIKHSILSLSALCEDIEDPVECTSDPSISRDRRLFALSQSTKACLLLTAPGADLCIEVLLVSCILSVYQQHAFGNYITALKHIRSGLEVWRSWQSRDLRLRERAAHGIIEHHIVPILSNIAYQYDLHFVGSSTPKLDVFDTTSMVKHLERTRFESISEAQNALGDTIRYFAASNQNNQQLSKGSGHSHMMSIHRCSDLLSHWFATFSSFILHHQGNVDNLKICSVRIEYFLGLLMISTHPYEGEKVFDNYTHVFVQIVEDARIMIHSDRVRGAKDCQKILGADFKLIMPLFIVIIYCRAPSIRRDALRLLRLYDRQEGSWSSQVVADVGEKVMILEEDNAKALRGGVRTCDDIDEEARVKIVRAEAHRLKQGFGSM